MSYTTAYHYLEGHFAPASSEYGSSPIRMVSGLSRAYATSGVTTQALDDETLDRILRQATHPLQTMDPLDVLVQKGLSLKERIRELLRQLELRYSLNQSIKDHLKQASLKTSSTLLNAERLAQLGDPVAVQRRSQSESRLDKLYQQGTGEQLDFWKDQQRLREQLVELLNEYRQAAARDRLIGSLRYGVGWGG